MRGDPPTDDFTLAYRLQISVREVRQMDDWERLGWDNFFEVHGVLSDLMARTAQNRA